MKTSVLFCLLVAAAAAFAGPVSRADAEVVASNFTFALRGASTAGSSWYYEDVAGGPGAWVCERVLGDGSSLTVMCGALSEMPPVLAYWKGKPLDVAVADRAQAVAVQSLGAGAQRARAVYYSPIECWFEYEAGGRTVMVSPTRLAASSAAEVRSVPPVKYGPADAQANEPLWSSYLKGGLPTDDPDSLRIAGVADWDWHYGCAPTSATNVLTYWDNNGYPLLVDSVMWLWDPLEHDWDWVANTNLQLTIAMHTDTLTGGTYVTDMAPGIKAVCNDAGWGNGYAFNSYLVPNGLGTMISELRAGRPGCFCVSSHPVYGNHAVTYVGWGPPDTSWICIHDEWPTPVDVVINYNYAPQGAPRYVIPVVPGGAPMPDMAVTAIIAPDTLIAQGSFLPTARVANLGNSSVPAKVFFSITGPGANYHDSMTVTVGPSNWTTVSFAAWNAIPGTFAARCSVAQPGDVDHSNDARGRTFRVPGSVPMPDMAVLAIVSPETLMTPGVFVPAARVANYGNSSTAAKVFFSIAGPGVNYRDSATVVLNPSNWATVQFRWCRADSGTFAARCSIAQDGDVDHSNDALGRAFRVPAVLPPPATTWHEFARMPAPTNAMVKDGGALAFMPANGWIYALKGNKTLEFNAYNTVGRNWQTLLSMPPGPAGKAVRAGGVLLSDGQRYVYALKGNGTFEFYRFDAYTGVWDKMADYPAGGAGRKVKGGGDMVFVPGGGTDYIYSLKGYNCEFYRYSTATNEWTTLAPAPTGTKGKWPKGSFMVFDGDQTIYAHKGSYHDLWTFNTATEAWSPSMLSGMPPAGSTGRPKRSKEGAAGVWQSNRLWALKGGGTGEFWSFDPVTRDWTEMDSVRLLGSTGRPRGVKQGGDLVAAGNTFYALKGNKTLEFWGCTVADQDGRKVAPAIGPNGGPAAGSGPAPANRLAVTPNPAHAGARVTLPDGCRRITVRDIAGRNALARNTAGLGSIDLDLGGLEPGVYLVTAETGGASSTVRLIVQ